VLLTKWQTKSQSLQLVLIIKELARGESLGRVHFEALHYEVRKDFVVKLQCVLLVDLQVENVLFCFLDRSSLEGILLRNKIIKAAAK
jgi:hypothetical protein